MADVDWTKVITKLETDARADVAEAKAAHDRAKRRLMLLEALRDHLTQQSEER